MISNFLTLIAEIYNVQKKEIQLYLDLLGTHLLLYYSINTIFLNCSKEQLNLKVKNCWT